MPTIVKLDERGRLILPAELRRDLPSDMVEIQQHAGKIILVPVKDPLAKLRSKISRAKPRRQLDAVAEEEATRSL